MLMMAVKSLSASYGSFVPIAGAIECVPEEEPSSV
jgi:hypothetical protein